MGQGRQRYPAMGLFLSLAAWPVLVVVYAFPLYFYVFWHEQLTDSDTGLASEFAGTIAYIAGSMSTGALSGRLGTRAGSWYGASLPISLAVLVTGSLLGGMWILALLSGFVPATMALIEWVSPALGRFAYERFCRPKKEPESPDDAASAGD